MTDFSYHFFSQLANHGPEEATRALQRHVFPDGEGTPPIPEALPFFDHPDWNTSPVELVLVTEATCLGVIREFRGFQDCDNYRIIVCGLPTSACPNYTHPPCRASFSKNLSGWYIAASRFATGSIFLEPHLPTAELGGPIGSGATERLKARPGVSLPAGQWRYIVDNFQATRSAGGWPLPLHPQVAPTRYRIAGTFQFAFYASVNGVLTSEETEAEDSLPTTPGAAEHPTPPAATTSYVRAQSADPGTGRPYWTQVPTWGRPSSIFRPSRPWFQETSSIPTVTTHDWGKPNTPRPSWGRPSAAPNVLAPREGLPHPVPPGRPGPPNAGARGQGPPPAGRSSPTHSIRSDGWDPTYQSGTDTSDSL
jgi:hypothetical protein